MTWPVVALGDICELRYGKSLPASVREGGPFPVMGSNGIVGSHKSAITAGPTVIVGRKGSIGAVAYTGSASWPIDTTYFIDKTTTAQDLRWVYWRLANLGLDKMNKSAAVPGLNRDDAYRVTFPLPPLPEQRRIASILDRAEELRSSGRSSIARHEHFLSEYFRETVSRSTSTTSLPLGLIATRITDGTHQSPEWASDGVPFLFVSNIVGGKIEYATEKFVSRDTYEQLTRHAPIEVGDVLYSAVGSYGVPVLVSDDRPFLFQRHIAHIKPRADLVNSRYLRDVLASSSVRRQADRVAKGVAQKTVTLGDLSQFSIPLIDRDAQEQYAALAAKSDQLHDRLAGRQSVLDELFASLQYGAFGGGL